MKFAVCINGLILSLLFITFADAAALKPQKKKHNDYACRSNTHPNPVVLLHALFGNEKHSLNEIQDHLRGLGFCTFTRTYGTKTVSPFLGRGGLSHIPKSAPEIAKFIKEVKKKTGANKIDLVGHSEGGFQAMYVAKKEKGISDIVDKIVSIAPPTHGTHLGGFFDYMKQEHPRLGKIVRNLVRKFACAACTDLLPDGAGVVKLNEGTIVQPGNNLTVIITLSDEIVTPAESAGWVGEAGVNNIIVQNACPHNINGHIGVSKDPYVLSVVANALDPSLPLDGCSKGIPW